MNVQDEVNTFFSYVNLLVDSSKQEDLLNKSDSDLDSLFVEDDKAEISLNTTATPSTPFTTNVTPSKESVQKDGKGAHTAAPLRKQRTHSVFMPRSFTRPKITMQKSNKVSKVSPVTSASKSSIENRQDELLNDAQNVGVEGYEDWMEDETFLNYGSKNNNVPTSDAFALTDEILEMTIQEVRSKQLAQLVQDYYNEEVTRTVPTSPENERETEPFKEISEASINKNVGRFKRSSVDRRSSDLKDCLSSKRLQKHFHDICMLNIPFNNKSRLFVQPVTDVLPFPVEVANALKSHLAPLAINRIRYLRGVLNNEFPINFNDKFFIITNNLKFNVNDFYSPEFFKINGNGNQLNSSRSGLCPYCIEEHFYDLLNSSYFYHLLGYHGVLASRIVPNPINYGVYNVFNIRRGISLEVTGGECPICTKFVEIGSNKDKPFYKYFDHFAKEHK